MLADLCFHSLTNQTKRMENDKNTRTRLKGVNDGIGKLKRYVPNMKTNSIRVETLRGAID